MMVYRPVAGVVVVICSAGDVSGISCGLSGDLVGVGVCFIN